MVDILQYPFFNSFSLAQNLCQREAFNPLVGWLLSGKIGENPVVTPSNVTQVIRPSALNRRLESVIVENRNPLYFSTDLAVDGVFSVNINGAATATSDTEATATVAVSRDSVTVTGVAAGTTTVRAYNAAGALLALIVVTVA